MSPSTVQLPSKISIIVPVYRGGAAFNHCLQLIEAYGQLAYETIVVIDGHDPESKSITQGFGFKTLQLTANAGPAKARNVGARAASGDVLFFVDADVALGPDTIYEVQKAFVDQNLDALIGSYDDAPGAANFLSQYKNLLHHYTHQQSKTQASTFWGACGAIRRSVFENIGGFDESYCKPSIEDIELGYRLTKAGYRIDLNKQVQVKHLKRWGIRSLLQADIFYRALPWTQLIWRDRKFVNDLNLDTGSRLSVVSVYLMVGLMLISPLCPALLLPSLACGGLLLILNASVYRFFWKKRSFSFALKVVPWHWLYYGYSGIAFVLGTLQYWLQQEPILLTSPPSSTPLFSVNQSDR